MASIDADNSINTADEDDRVFGGPTTETRKRLSDYVPCRCNQVVVVTSVVVLIICGVVAISVSLAVTLSRSSDSSGSVAIADVCDVVPRDRRFDCFPTAPGAEMAASESSCRDRGCCWSPAGSVRCYYPHGPRQVHLALTGSPTEMLVSWLELGAASDSG